MKENWTKKQYAKKCNLLFWQTGQLFPFWKQLPITASTAHHIQSMHFLHELTGIAITDKPNNIILYQTPDGAASLEVRLDHETVWITQKQMAELFQRERSVITKHLRNVFAESELDEKSNVQNMHFPFSDKPVALYSGRRPVHLHLSPFEQIRRTNYTGNEPVPRHPGRGEVAPGEDYSKAKANKAQTALFTRKNHLHLHLAKLDSNG